MKNNYIVKLINHQGCIFDNGEFTNLRKARKWASGRGETFEFGKFHKYTVHIIKNRKYYKDYKTS